VTKGNLRNEGKTHELWRQTPANQTCCLFYSSIAPNNGGLPEIVKKVEKELLFNGWGELKDIILNFSRNEFSS
jgi:hypothetical protein